MFSFTPRADITNFLEHIPGKIPALLLVESLLRGEPRHVDTSTSKHRAVRGMIAEAHMRPADPHATAPQPARPFLVDAVPKTREKTIAACPRWTTMPGRSIRRPLRCR